MAERLAKLRLRILLSIVVVFIIVSVSSAEHTRCYWCGPLAEQVHRSQRAPSCSNFHLEPHETDCDPGYSYCATIAVAPPYTESRLCVKFYQDECYSLYCNSTKTWRMVCACKGDLCNGPHSERETQAFALVPKFSKSKPRNRRNLVSNFISVKTRTPTNDDNTVIIMSKELNDTQSILNDQPIESNDNISHPITPTPTRAEDNVMIVHGTLKNVEKSMIHDPSRIAEVDSHDDNKKHSVETTKSDVEEKYDTTKMDTQGNEEKIESNTNDHKTDKQQEEEKMDKSNTTTVNKSLGKSKMNTIETVTQPATEIVKQSEDPTTVTTTMKPTTAEITVAVKTSATPEKMPPAEALQQNVTPTKAMEVTTMGTVATSTDINHIMETTTISSEVNKDKDNSKKNNTGSQVLAAIMTLVICILVQYCL